MELFDNFFDSSSLIVKLYERDFCGIFKAQNDSKEMPEMSASRKMKRDDFKHLCFDKVVCSKYLDVR